MKPVLRPVSFFRISIDQRQMRPCFFEVMSLPCYVVRTVNKTLKLVFCVNLIRGDSGDSHHDAWWLEAHYGATKRQKTSALWNIVTYCHPIITQVLNVWPKMCSLWTSFQHQPYTCTRCFYNIGCIL